MNEIDLMSPSKVAEAYGGDKRKIGQAVQMGLIDPTVGVMAGMFIDRIRAAAAKEQQPTATVAQEVMAPAMAPATPPVMPAAGLAAAQAAPVERGLAALPVPEEAVPNEYAGGGIVAFQNRGLVDLDLSDPEALMELERRRLAEMQDNPPPTVDAEAAPINKAASLEDLISQATARRAAIGLSEAEKAYQERLKGASDRAKAAKERSFHEFLVDMGFRTAASKSPRFLQALGESGAAATPRLIAGAKEASEIEEAGLKGLADIGKAERLEKLAGITAGEKMYGDERTLLSREEQAKLDRENRLAIAQIPDKALQVATKLIQDNPKMSYLDAVAQASQALTPRDTYNATRNAVSAAAKDANAEFTTRATFDSKLQEDIRKAAQGDKDAQARVDAVRNRIQQEVFRLYQVQGVDLSGGKMGPAPAAGGGGRGTVDTSNPLLR